MTTWVAPRTWATDDKVTASILNVELRDNFDVLFDDKPRPPHDNPMGLLFAPAATATVGTNNNCHWQRMYRGAVNTSIRKVAFQINAASGTFGVAIYTGSSSGITAVPSARVATTGSITVPATGNAIVDLGSTVTGVGQGTHWLALSASTTAFQFVGLTGGTGTTYQAGLAAAQTTAHPPPDPAVPTATAAVIPEFYTLPA